MYPKVALVAELIMEVESGGKVGNIADGIYVNTSIILNKV
jgi:hypothetical protein